MRVLASRVDGGASIRPAGQVFSPRWMIAAQKGARRDHDGAGADRPAVFQNDPGASAVSADSQIAGRALDDLEARLLGQDGLHRRAIQLAVGLGARAADRRTLAAVQHAKLDAGPVDRPRHDAVQRIDLAHQMAFRQAADRRVARHDADGLAIVGEQHGPRAGARCRRRRLAAGMTAADHDDIGFQGSRAIHPARVCTNDREVKQGARFRPGPGRRVCASMAVPLAMFHVKQHRTAARRPPPDRRYRPEPARHGGDLACHEMSCFVGFLLSLSPSFRPELPGGRRNNLP